MSHGVFVTGTDTGVGKTAAACALLHALRVTGVRARPLKPIAAGAIRFEGEWANEDTLALRAAAGLDDLALEAITPVLLREALAPEIAAAMEGRPLELGPVREAFERATRAAAFVVVEGVGGFDVPLSAELDTVDMAQEMRLPVAMVVGMRLGCLNHAMLTAQAIERAGLPFAGWIANAIDPQMRALDENVAALERRLPGPLLGRLPHSVPPLPQELAMHLDVRPLLKGVVA